MELKIGLYRYQAGWEIMLQQEGLQFEYMRLETKIPLHKYSVIIINDIIDRRQQAWVDDFIKNGGAALFESSAYSRIKKTSTKSIKKGFLIPEQNSIFSDVGLIDFYTKFTLLKESSFSELDRVLCIQYKQTGKGFLIILPFEVNQLITDKKSVRKKFWAERKELPSEIVAKVSKGKIRKIVSKCIEFLHQKRDLPFVQLWHFPHTWKNIFLFRVDTDYCNPEEALELYNICHKNEIRGTWFADTVSKDTITQVLKGALHQEIALHCRRHLVFSNFKRNYKNIEKGLSDIKELGITVSGFAAPYGEWNENLARVLEYFDFDYSSEFTLDYDNLPFYPNVDKELSHVLQLPIHPVSAGRLRRSHFNENEKWEYYKHYIDRQIASYEPVSIYHHPTHGNIELFDRIFKYINDMKINKMTYSQFASWWKSRLRLSYHITYNDGLIHCGYTNNNHQLSLKISYNNMFALTKLQKSIRLDSLDMREQSSSKITRNIKRIRKKHWRDWLYDFESKRGKRKQ